MRLKRVVVLLAALSCHFTAEARFQNLTEQDCEKRVSGAVIERQGRLEVPKWTDDLGLIRADLEEQAWSSVRTYFSKEWDTQVYYTATGAPNREIMEVPLVDPDSKAVVVFFHGSGTAKSGGANFIANMSAVSKMGYTGISFDMPFHAQGSLRDKMNDADQFMLYLKRIIEHIKSYGKPVYLAGHSFGPDMIFELVSRYPNLVQGALAISPAGFTPTLRNWYERYTSRMRFGGAVPENRMGGEWAGRVSEQFGWSVGQFGDPTERNPNLRLRILSGDREEYVPAPIGGANRTPIGPNTYDIRGPLRRLFRNSAIVIEQGIGHYLFDFRDQNGFNVVLRELSITLGEDLKEFTPITQAAAKTREARGLTAKIGNMARTDLIFRSWMQEFYNLRMIAEIVNREDNRLAGILLQQYTEARAQRFGELMLLVYNTETTDPEFYAKYQAKIEAAKQKGKLDFSLLGPYFMHKNGGASVSIN